RRRYEPRGWRARRAPGREDFSVSNFHPDPILEIWRKTIFGGERGCWRGSGVACFGATSLEKIICGVIAIISFRPGGCSSLPCRGVLSFRSEAREASAVKRRECITLLGGAAASWRSCATKRSLIPAEAKAPG